MKRSNGALVWLAALLVPGLIGLEVKGEDAKGEGSAMRLYIGTYTGPKSKGIYTMKLDPATGTLTTPELATELKNPSFLAIHPNQKYLYAIAEIDEFKGQKAGGIAAFSIDPASGKLTLINQQSTGGPGPA